MSFLAQIRNFCIISHVDHGKSTLADRFLELTGTVEPSQMRDQYLDTMDLERERGITIKMQPCRMVYRLPEALKKKLNFTECILNLIDTPGHVDFSYEVSRSLACCEGAILVVDAVSGVQAQTVNHVNLALKYGLIIIPAVNKIDLPEANPQKVALQIKKIFGLNKEIIFISAKKGEGVPYLLETLIKKIPPPQGAKENPLKALVFDSYYDSYRGVVASVRVFEGRLKAKEKILLLASGKEAEVLEVGYFRPHLEKTKSLEAGEIGYIITGLKEASECRIGDTITSVDKEKKIKVAPIPGYEEPQPVIFAGFFPPSDKDFSSLKSAFEKLKLNDASLVFSPFNFPGLGAGLQCGFLGLLHLEIIKERLKREFGLSPFITLPSVPYKVFLKNGEILIVQNPASYPSASEIKRVEEIFARLEIITPPKYLGPILKMLEAKRAIYKETKYSAQQQVILVYEAPLAEIVIPSPFGALLADQLKAVSSGYASLNYQIIGFRPTQVAKLEILIAGEPQPLLARIVPQEKVYKIARNLVLRLKELIPRQLFPVNVQAAVGRRIIAAAKIPAFRKDVLAKLYGGDYTRKLKLLTKQKKGKKRMQALGKVILPEKVILELMRVDKYSY